MRYSAEHKKATRARILDAAGRLFRSEGYGGSGIDGLTKAAGVTNGAFYGHFKSKREAFRMSVLAGLDELRLGILALKASRKKRWLRSFITFYLGPKRVCDIGESCALPSLSAEVMRADAPTRQAYGVELRRLVEEVAPGLPGRSRRQREDQAIALLALLSGGVTLSRAVPDPELSERIAEAVGRVAFSMGSARKPSQR
jgi:TetR/AcrR family transcriptional repressor of nem operon